jgi:DNA-binding beta-propeller fold protein YncE
MEWITTFSSPDNFPKTGTEVSVEKFLGKKDADRFRKPVAVATDSSGLVYVADMDAGLIQVIDFDAREMSPYAEGGMGMPLDLAFDSRGNLYVAEGMGKQILVFSPDRKPLTAIGSGELGKPNYIAINEELGRLYVTDVINHAVVVFDLNNGDKLFSFGGIGVGEGEMHGPMGIAIDKNNRVFVAEQFNARIQVFDADGNHQYMFGSRGDDDFQFEGPRGLAFDSEGNLFVAEARKASILLFQPDGTPLTSLGARGTSTHQLGFTLPSSVSIDDNDRIYISDGMNKRITIWQMLTPKYLAEHPLDQEALKRLEEKVMRMSREKEGQ